MSTWIKDGKSIVANYLGQTVTGTVVASRVKYGGRIQYTVNLDQPVQFRWRAEPSSQVLIDREEIITESAQ